MPFNATGFRPRNVTTSLIFLPARGQSRRVRHEGANVTRGEVPMQKKFGIVALGLGLSASWASVAAAQTRDFTKGTFSIGAERMMGFDHWSENVTTAGVETNEKSDQFTLL